MRTKLLLTSVLFACSLNFSQLHAQGLNAHPAPTIDASAARALSAGSVAVSSAVAPTVVCITAPTRASDERRLQYWMQYYGESYKPNRARPHSLGSGVILTENGYIVTNNHVIEDVDLDSILVSLSDGSSYYATLIGADKSTDLAVLRIYGSHLPAAYVANSDSVKVGEYVIAVGSPLGLRSTVTAGIISAIGRDERAGDEQEETINNYLQTDAAINPGNSGGGLFNLEGKLIGINSAMITQNGGNIGYGLAIPSNLMRAVAEDLMKDGQVHRGSLGIGSADVEEEIACKLRLPCPRGVRIDEIATGSAAEVAGLKVNDVILAVDGTSFPASSWIQTALATKKPGDSISMRIWRDGAQQDFRVTLQQPPPKSPTEPEKKPEYRAALGLNCLPIDPPTLSRLGFTNMKNVKGVYVTSTDRFSSASKAGIYEDDIITGFNTAPVRTPEDLATALEASRPGDLAQLNLLRKKQPLTKAVILQAMRKD